MGSSASIENTVLSYEVKKGETASTPTYVIGRSESLLAHEVEKLEADTSSSKSHNSLSKLSNKMLSIKAIQTFGRAHTNKV